MHSKGYCIQPVYVAIGKTNCCTTKRNNLNRETLVRNHANTLDKQYEKLKKTLINDIFFKKMIETSILDSSRNCLTFREIKIDTWRICYFYRARCWISWTSCI